jgi:hypothetical protein
MPCSRDRPRAPRECGPGPTSSRPALKAVHARLLRSIDDGSRRPRRALLRRREGPLVDGLGVGVAPQGRQRDPGVVEHQGSDVVAEERRRGLAEGVGGVRRPGLEEEVNGLRDGDRLRVRIFPADPPIGFMKAAAPRLPSIRRRRSATVAILSPSRSSASASWGASRSPRLRDADSVSEAGDGVRRLSRFRMRSRPSNAGTGGTASSWMRARQKLPWPSPTLHPATALEAREPRRARAACAPDPRRKRRLNIARRWRSGRRSRGGRAAPWSERSPRGPSSTSSPPASRSPGRSGASSPKRSSLKSARAASTSESPRAAIRPSRESSISASGSSLPCVTSAWICAP